MDIQSFSFPKNPEAVAVIIQTYADSARDKAARINLRVPVKN